MGEIVVDLVHLTLSVFVVLVLLRIVEILARKRMPSVSHGLQFAIGKE